MRSCAWLIVVLVLVAGCGGGTPEPRTGADEAKPATSVAGDEEEGEELPSPPCETSDDCAAGQICVDDGCAIPVPAGFY